MHGKLWVKIGRNWYYQYYRIGWGVLPITKINCIVVGIVMVMHGIIVGSIFNYIYRVAECGLCWLHSGAQGISETRNQYYTLADCLHGLIQIPYQIFHPIFPHTPHNTPHFLLDNVGIRGIISVFTKIISYMRTLRQRYCARNHKPKIKKVLILAYFTWQ